MATDRSKQVRVRAYNVGFGDAILVRVPGRSKYQFVLVDFGNAIGRGGSNAMFPAIAEDIEKETNGRLDVLVMSHKHVDHMEGYYHQLRTRT